MPLTQPFQALVDTFTNATDELFSVAA
jgi:hypothetical protein